MLHVNSIAQFTHIVEHVISLSLVWRGGYSKVPLENVHMCIPIFPFPCGTLPQFQLFSGKYLLKLITSL